MIRLIFFDIDGTLIYHTHTYSAIRMERYAYAIKETWGIDVPVDLPKYEGWIDRGLAWDVVQKYGISRENFLQKLPKFNVAMRKFLDRVAREKEIYNRIPEAKKLLDILKQKKSLFLALLTGNVETIARWKLEITGLSEYFAFGIFGDEADNKVDLANHAIDKANSFFKEAFIPEEVVVIGDTPFDIECGKAMGAHTVGVATGRHNIGSEQFQTSGAELVVGSLMDEALLVFLGFSHHEKTRSIRY